MMTSLSDTTQEFSPEARAEAAAWIARLHGPQRSAAAEAGFRRWLESDPQNAKVFERMTEIWDAVGTTQAGRYPRVSPLQRKPRARPLAIAAAVLVTCAIGLLTTYGVLRDPTYVTAIGEQRTVDLKDGSHVTLNSSTRVHVHYRDDIRRVQLVEGEAIFEVAHDEQRPFVVVAGDHEVKALGTVFLVRQAPDTTAVTLLEGKVAITTVSSRADREAGSASVHAMPAAEPAPIVTLTPGERFTVTAKRTEMLDTPPLEVVTAWRRGEVILDRTSLAEAAAEMNRYGESVIVIDDAEIGGIRISGNYKAGDAEGFARAVAGMYGLEADVRGKEIHLRPQG